MRSALDAWIQECHECGYISESVSDSTNVKKEWLQSNEYLTCDGISFVSKLAKQFYKCYLIKKEDQNTKAEFFAILRIAWACDDENDTENAKYCRELAIPLATTLIEERNKIQLVRADLMRRAGQFNQLFCTYTPMRFENKQLNRILKFEIEKAKNNDLSCYRLEDVLGCSVNRFELRAR